MTLNDKRNDILQAIKDTRDALTKDTTFVRLQVSRGEGCFWRLLVGNYIWTCGSDGLNGVANVNRSDDDRALDAVVDALISQAEAARY